MHLNKKLILMPLMGIFLALSSCKKNTANISQSLPTLAQVQEEQHAETVNEKTPKPVEAPKNIESKEAESTAEQSEQPSEEPSNTNKKNVTLRFVAYNLANWLTLESRFDFDSKKTFKNASKPEKEKSSVIQIVSSARPDVFGCCEIGTKEDLQEVQSRLKTAGLDLPYLHYAGGMDGQRHLGFLSKFPIVSTEEKMNISYKIQDKEFQIKRGILDATIKTPDGREWRFIGLHLKSKRDVEEEDQEVIRQNEAQLVRNHLDSILSQKPDTRLICYGDFNSTRRENATKIIQGKFDKPNTMSPIGLHDSREQYWTHFWEREDIYSRFDYILTSPTARKTIIYKECGILDPENWNDASDHRAVMAAFE